MTAGRLNFTIEQGATFARVLTVSDDEVPRDLTGYTARMKIKETVDDIDSIMTLTTENDRITLSDQGTDPGEFTLLLSAVDTQDTAFDSFEGGVYDLELVSGAVVERLVEGKIKFKRQVTD